WGGGDLRGRFEGEVEIQPTNRAEEVPGRTVRPKRRADGAHAGEPYLSSDCFWDEALDTSKVSSPISTDRISSGICADISANIDRGNSTSEGWLASEAPPFGSLFGFLEVGFCFVIGPTYPVLERDARENIGLARLGVSETHLYGAYKLPQVFEERLDSGGVVTLESILIARDVGHVEVRSPKLAGLFAELLEDHIPELPGAKIVGEAEEVQVHDDLILLPREPIKTCGGEESRVGVDV